MLTRFSMFYSLSELLCKPMRVFAPRGKLVVVVSLESAYRQGLLWVLLGLSKVKISKKVATHVATSTFFSLNSNPLIYATFHRRPVSPIRDFPATILSSCSDLKHLKIFTLTGAILLSSVVHHKLSTIPSERVHVT